MKLFKSVFLFFIAISSQVTWGFNPSEPAPFTLKLDGNGHEQVVDSATDDDGNLYLVGFYENGSNTTINIYGDGPGVDNQRTIINSTVLPENNGGQDFFVAKFNWLGELQWFKFVGGTGKDGATGIVYERSSGRVFLTGYITGTVFFGLQPVQANASSTGLDSESTTNLFLAVIDPDSGEWLDIQTQPLAAQITETNFTQVASRTLENLVITAGNEQQGNGLTMARETDDPLAPIVFYLKGQVKQAENLAVDQPPANGTDWLGRVGLEGSTQYTTALFQGQASGAKTTSSGNWAFITKVRYYESPGIGQQTWNWDWLSRVNQGLDPVAGASDNFVDNCEGVDVGTNLDLGQQIGADNSTVRNPAANVTQASPELSLTFQDPLPAGAIITSINVGIDFAALLGFEFGAVSYQFDARIEGINIGQWSAPPTQAGVTQYYPVSTTINYNSSLATYQYGGNNELILRLQSGIDIRYDKVVVTLNYTIPSGEPCSMDVLTDIVVDPSLGINSPIYFSGKWRSGFQVGADIHQAESGRLSGYVGSMTSNGTWRNFAKAGGYSSIEALHFGDDGKILAAGFAGLSADTATNVVLDSFGAAANPPALSPGVFGSTSALFAKLNLNGVWEWAELNSQLAASYDLTQALTGQLITTGTTLNSNGFAAVAQLTNDSGGTFSWIEASTEPLSYGYHLHVNNLNTLYLFGGTQNYAGAPFSTVLTNNAVEYSDIDNTAADLLSGLGTVAHVLDPVSGDFQPEFQNYYNYIVGDLIYPQVTGLNAPDTIGLRRTIPVNLGLESPAAAAALSLNQQLLTVQSDLSVYGAGPIENAIILWPTSNNALATNQEIVGRAVKVRWPTVAEGLQEYIYSVTPDVEIPPVELNPPGALNHFHWLQYLESVDGIATTDGAVATNDQLITIQNRMGSLVFFDDDDPTQGQPTIVSFRSFHWDDPLKHIDNINVDIGKTVATPDELLLAQNSAGGYVMTTMGRYDTTTDVYHRDNREGQIVPINENGTEDNDADSLDDLRDDLRVAWYQTGAQDREWPYISRSYVPIWPADAGLIALTSQLGSDGLQNGQNQPLTALTGADFPVIYSQNDRLLPGYNPNEEHAFIRFVDDHYRVHAIRNDLNNIAGLASSEPYVIARSPFGDDYQYRVFKVDYSSDDYPEFQLTSEVGSPVNEPSYLRDRISESTAPGNINTESSFWIDRNNQVWSRSAGTDQQQRNVDVNYFYSLTDPSFWFDADGDGQQDSNVTEVAWMSYHDGNNATPHTLTFDNEWPASVPTIYAGDTLINAKNGLPDVKAMRFLQVIYDDNDPIVEGDPSSATRAQDATVRLFNYAQEIRVDLGNQIEYRVDANSEGPVVIIDDGSNPTTLPARIRPTLGVGVYDFPRLPSDLRYRVRFQFQLADPQGGYFYFRGGDFNPETAQDDTSESAVQLVNVMTAAERDVLQRLDNSGTDPFSNVTDEEATLWDTVVNAMYDQSRNPNGVDLDNNGQADQALYVGLEQDGNSNETQHLLVDSSVALTAAFADQPGYVVLAENVDDPNLTGNPVNLHVIRVEEPIASGSINVFQNEINKLDTRLVLRQNLDFAGRSNNLTFEWFWAPADESSNDGPPSYNIDPQGRPIGWTTLVNEANGQGKASFYLDSGLPLLADGWVLSRYKGIVTEADPTGDQWSELSGAAVLPGQPAEPMLVQGWVKRVMSNINEFEQRYTDFHANDVNSYTSMLVQAGPEYQGDVALNGEGGNLNEVGLIELYQTILNYAVNLSIDSGITGETAVNKQLLFAASRIASLYMLLGNEAFSDAMDPTIGYDGSSGESYLQPTLFAFENTVPSLLSEELALLRGLDNNNPTVGNRLLWNFVGGGPEATYVQVYGISDTDGDGALDDAQANYPQGHGDAWGHYLTSTKLYYSLARHPDYDWQPLTDTTSIAGQTLVVDYKDEERFAKAAAAKARTGARIVDLTFRNEYTHAPSGQWQGYKDTDAQRAWGMDGWARRAGQGAVLDWAFVNALLPYDDTESTGIAKIDRQTVSAIADLPAALVEIDSIVSRADRGNNPFGLASDAIPFDIDASALQNGESHFEQVYARAVDAANNSLELFNYANDLSQKIRISQLSNADFQRLEEEKEGDFKSRLIELMGYPYNGNIGPGKLYPTGYNGPDIYQYMYIDSDLENVPPSQINNLTLTLPSLQADGCSQSCANDINSFFFSADTGGNINPADHINFVDGSGNLLVELPIVPSNNYPYIKPNETWGSRAAPGEIQLQLGEIQLIQARIETAIAEQQALMNKVKAEVDLLETIYQIRGDQITSYNVMKDEYATLTRELAGLQGLANNLVLLGESIYRWIGIMSNTPATAVGFSNDAGTIPRIGLSVTYSGLTRGLITASALVSIGQFTKQAQVQQAAFNRSVEFQKSGYPLEIQRQLTVIEKLMHEETKLRYSVVELTQELENAQSVYQKLVAEAVRIMEERIAFRKDVASRTTDERYRDMTYRVFRNDALQKYRASFDLAAKYTYLAAKAFDYETGLLSDDTNGVDQTFYESLIKQRTLGQFTDSGNPVAGVHGLSTPLARMDSAFNSAESAFGGLDPLNQEFNFSLRKEAYRVLDGDDGKSRWQQLLQEGRVDNLWEVPEFSEFCVPPGVNAADGPLEGIVLRFATTIHLDKNLFGWDKGGVDSTYSPSYSATKFYRVGLHFDDYPDELVNTPYAYLVPVGTDFLRSPTDITQLRSYQVLDQAIPVPSDLTTGDTSYLQEGWIPSSDSVLTRWDKRRRFSEIPVSTDPVFDFANVTTSGRLVGRSVWNTEWVLIIPGDSLAADGSIGLDTLISGDDNNATNEGVTDIRLVFDTYSFPAQ
ncbi:MAG: hypothetical protein MI867_10355 [Pseudomonadales bacterium]|nr:hypothetical protein [Pseudomonadales bacterium]